MPWREWYDALAKPFWTPAPATIGLIWSILYPIILVTFGFVFVQAMRGKIPWRVALPFAINLVANLIFSATSISAFIRRLPPQPSLLPNLICDEASLPIPIRRLNHQTHLLVIERNVYWNPFVTSYIHLCEFRAVNRYVCRAVSSPVVT